MKTKIIFLIALFSSFQVFGQNNDTIPNDTVKTLKPKVEHAEPLYVDLMRDLGARKGEAEINVGFGIGNHKNYNELYGFVEYEWAVADRVGLEVEVPFSFHQSHKDSL